MRVILVHNPDAGSGDHVGTELLARLRDAGHDAAYTSTEASSLIRELDQHPDVVLAAGGDGTVAAVARLMSARSSGVPLSILPVGTANNLATSLGVHGDVQRIVDGLDPESFTRLDVGMATGLWGTAMFVESAGVGAFAEMLRDAERDAAAGTTSAESRGVDRGARFREALARTRPRHWYVSADGGDLSGDYLVVMALNIPYVGPSLELAPDADPSDGRLDLLLVREADREALGSYLDGISDHEERPLRIPTRRVREVRLGWMPQHGHLDDHVWPEAPASNRLSERGGIVEIEVRPSALQILVPPRL